jgi:hypothetical protein
MLKSAAAFGRCGSCVRPRGERGVIEADPEGTGVQRDESEQQPEP